MIINEFSSFFVISVTNWFSNLIFLDNNNDSDKDRIFSIGFQMLDENIDIIQKREKCKNRKSASISDKFFLLMWKNFLLQYRHKLQTILQILIPMLFTLNLLFIRLLVKPETDNGVTRFEPFGINQSIHKS